MDFDKYNPCMLLQIRAAAEKVEPGAASRLYPTLPSTGDWEDTGERFVFAHHAPRPQRTQGTADSTERVSAAGTSASNELANFVAVSRELSMAETMLTLGGADEGVNVARSACSCYSS